MARAIKSIPRVPNTTDPELYAILSALKEAVEIMAGQRGKTEEQSPSIRQLIDARVTNARQIR